MTLHVEHDRVRDGADRVGAAATGLQEARADVGRLVRGVQAAAGELAPSMSAGTEHFLSSWTAVLHVLRERTTAAQDVMTDAVVAAREADLRAGRAASGRGPLVL